MPELPLSGIQEVLADAVYIYLYIHIYDQIYIVHRKAMVRLSNICSGFGSSPNIAVFY